jgi:DNA-binding GntR family transcriptional regulator
MREAAGSGDAYREAAIDTEFHRLIMHHAGNATLERVWSTLEPFLRTYITIVSPKVDRRAVADRHVPIVDALRRQNPLLIEDAMRMHFEAAASALAEAWPSHASVVSDAGEPAAAEPLSAMPI